MYINYFNYLNSNRLNNKTTLNKYCNNGGNTIIMVALRFLNVSERTRDYNPTVVRQR